MSDIATLTVYFDADPVLRALDDAERLSLPSPLRRVIGSLLTRDRLIDVQVEGDVVTFVPSQLLRALAWLGRIVGRS